jgi:hypothetical protein
LPMPVIDAEVVPESPPDRGASERTRAEQDDGPPTRPAPARAPRSRQLDSAEEAVAATASANRRSTRRRR